MQDYRCIRHLQSVPEQTPEEFITYASAILKGTGEEQDKAYSIMIASVSTIGLPNSPAILEALVADQSGGGGGFSSAPRWYCSNMTKYLTSHDCVCACVDCPRKKVNRDKDFDLHQDRSVIQWCIMDTDFFQFIQDKQDKVDRLVKKGFLCSPVMLLDTEQYSYAFPLYLSLYQNLKDVPYQLVYHQVRGEYTGIDQEELDGIFSVIHAQVEKELSNIPSSYHAAIFQQLDIELNYLTQLKNLADREKTLSGLQTLLVPSTDSPKKAPKPVTSPSSTPAGAGADKPATKPKMVFPTATMPQANPSPNPSAKPVPVESKPEPEQSEEGRALLNLRKTLMTDEIKKPATPKKSKPRSEAEDEFAYTEFPFRDEPVRTEYPYDPSELHATPVQTEVGFSDLFYMLVESQWHYLPMEMVRDAEGNLSALLYIRVPASKTGEFYIVSEKYFSLMEQSRVFQQAKPLCFQPYAILSSFPSLKKIHSLSILWNSFYHKQYIPAAEGLLYDQGLTRPEGEPLLSFLLKNYIPTHEHLLSILDQGARERYKVAISQSVYRSTGYRMRGVYSPAEKKGDFLFSFSGRDYRNCYTIHNLRPVNGYVKYRILIKDLPSGALADIVNALATHYCEHSHYRNIDLVFLGTIETYNELDYAVRESHVSTFLETMQLELIRITDRLLGGKAEIIIQREEG